MRIRVLLLVAAAFAPAAFFACNGDEPADDDEEPTPAEKACAAIAEHVSRCGGGACDDALVADCAQVVAIMSDPYLEALTACVEGGGAPLGCLQSSLGSLAPTGAHRDLAARFCSECALGVPGCESAFFSTEGDDERLGLALLPFGDDLVAEVAESCTSGITCAATFLSCAQGVLAERAIPEATLGCVIDNVTGSAPPPAGGECGGGGSGGGGSAGTCDPAGSWQMQETLLSSNCTADGVPFSLSITPSATGHDIAVQYSGSYPCTGSVDALACEARFDCSFGANASASYTVRFDGDAASGEEHYDDGACIADYSLAGTRAP